jgi:hypothetical protein
MTEKRISKKVWLSYGRILGFGIGFTVNKYFFDLQLGFWYVGLEY